MCSEKTPQNKPAKKHRITKKDQERLAALAEPEKEARAAGLAVLAGADEAGKGPLAGPVMAACVIMPEEALIPGIFDSKSLSENKRAHLHKEIRKTALAVGIGEANSENIDCLGIDPATQNAFVFSIQAACEALGGRPDFLFLDTFHFTDQFVRGLPCPYKAVVGADRKVYSVAAASIVAKVARDRIMRRVAEEYPGYGFDRNKEYGTAEHREAIVRLGPSPVHRLSFLTHRAEWKKELGL